MPGMPAPALNTSSQDSPREGAADSICESSKHHPGPPTQATNPIDSLAAFETWLLKNKAVCPMVSVQFSPGEGYHLLAAQDIAKGQTVVDIQPELLFTSDAALQSETFGAIIRGVSYVCEDDATTSDDHTGADDGFRWNVRDTLTLILFLLHERSKGNGSRWFEYINVLPSPESFTTPLFFEQAELDLLGTSTNLYWTIRGNRERLVEFYQSVIPALRKDWGDAFAKEKYCTWKYFAWAYSCLDSRAFKFWRPGSTNDEDTSLAQDRLVVVMSPLADFANHDPKCANLGYIGSRQGSETFKLVATQDIKHGESLLLKYNNFANDELLLYYGFVLPDNQLDSISISLDGIEAEAEDDLQTSIKRELLLTGLGEDLGIGYLHGIRRTCHGGIPASLLASLRILLMKPSELELVTIDNLQNIVTLDPCESLVDTETEILAWRTLQSLLNALANTFPTTLNEDLEVLTSDSYANACEKVVRQYLVTLKSIFMDANTTCEEHLKRLQ